MSLHTMDQPVTKRTQQAGSARADVEARVRHQLNGRKPALVARDLWQSYNGSDHVLQGVDVQIDRAAMTMIVGRSGSGKTTLLKALNGLIGVERGSVELVTDGETDHRRLRRRLAYVPQNLGLVRSMSALENTLTGALAYTNTFRSILRLFPRQTVQEAKAALTSLGLASKLDEKVYALSGGERQRVAIARALMQRPDVILADEFVSQLDPVTTEEILTMMRAVVTSGVGLLITTHEIDIVAKHADRLIVMRTGKVEYDGAPDRVSQGELLELLR